MTKSVYEGVATALITPLTADGIDYEAFGRLIDWQISEGVDALVVCGTTGEASTFTDDEHRDAIAYAVRRVAGRVPVIAGTGSNDTGYALDLTRCACEAGADAVLVVTPYYNKATQNGLIRMFTQIADASTSPVLLYNVPSRTGVNIEPTTYEVLADHPNIAGIKEANGNISKIVETMARVGDRLDLYSGNDDQIVPLLALGGRYHALIDALFCEVNPIPVKAAMAAMGYCENYLRLPLTPMEPAHWERLRALMAAEGLLS